jgi:uncharacterized protein with HEPN domain
MPSSNPRQRFEDILDNISRIYEYAQGIGYDEFITTNVKYDAIAYCFVRLTEAASKLGKEAERLEPSIDWGAIRGMGNKLRHLYDGIDSVVIWSAIQNEFPRLEVACRSALNKLPPDSP